MYNVRVSESDQFGCARCEGGRLFAADEPYTYLKSQSGAWEVCCLGCAAYAGLGMKDGPPPLT